MEITSRLSGIMYSFLFILSVTSPQHPYILHIKGVLQPNLFRFSHGHLTDAETELRDNSTMELISLPEKAFGRRDFTPVHCFYFILLSHPGLSFSQDTLCFLFECLSTSAPPPNSSNEHHPGSTFPFVCPHNPLHYV